jgi:DNA (cytosine-5)-methyltransferase 1
MRVVELFCGAGGLSLGLKQAGFTIVQAYDFWEPALKIYEDNLKDLLSPMTGLKKTRRRNLGGVNIAAIKEIDGKKSEKKEKAIKDLIEELEAIGDIVSLIPEIFKLAPDLIAGGPPCQPWSQMGPRKGDNDPRARLTTAFATVIAAVRPRYFIMENVKQIQKYKTYEQIRAMLKKAGYGLTEEKLDASYYGVAQARERFLLIGCLGECDGWLKDQIVAAKSTERTTVADVLGPDFGMPHIRVRTPDGNEVWRAAGPDTAEDTVNFFWLSPAYRKKDVGSTPVDRPVKTVLKNMLRPRHSEYPLKQKDVQNVHILPIPTFEQLAQIAGFPENWNWSKAKSTDRLQALTNAVPPPMAAAVGKCIIAHDRGEASAKVIGKRIPPGFLAWLKGKKRLKGPRLSQTVSEFRAVRQFFGSRVPKDADEAFKFLNALPAFQELGASRKSNLRRALRLYAECDASRSSVAVVQTHAMSSYSNRRHPLGRRSSSVPSLVPEMPNERQRTSFILEDIELMNGSEQ